LNVVTRLNSAKAAIAVGATVLSVAGVAGVAGAATGALPGPAQRVADRVLGAVGVDAPGQVQGRGLGRADAAGVAEGDGCRAGKTGATCQGTSAGQGRALGATGPDAAGAGDGPSTTSDATSTTASGSTGQGPGSAPASPAGGRYIVVLKDSVTSPAGVAQSQAKKYGAQLGFVYRAAIKGYSATLSGGAVRALRTDPLVDAVVEDREVHVAAQTLPTGIDRIDGEASSTISGDGAGSVDADVAIIDTGIDPKHPDLNVVGGVGCNGKGYDDRNGHGTHVAGIAAARDNSVGVVGVAPGARLWAVRVLNSRGSGSWSNVICGVDWVTAHAGTIDVANLSLGGAGSDPAASGCSTSDPLHDAICRSVAAGVTYVAAAGNSSADAKDFVPAAYDEVITVSALADFDGQPGGGAAASCRADVDDTLADFSNFGGDVDLIAPGVCITSTYRGGRYATLSGTSMASPHVAGAAALYRAAHPGASPAEVSSALRSAASLDWSGAGDPDGIHEPLLNVDAL
jgi:subtilisin family serine protease